jgi:hypothetical protein
MQPGQEFAPAGNSGTYTWSYLSTGNEVSIRPV